MLDVLWSILLEGFPSVSYLLRFSPAQAELYQAVLEVQRSCLSLCSPGVSLDHIYSTMLDLLGRQLTQLGILKATSNNANALKVHKMNRKLNRLLLFTECLFKRSIRGIQKKLFVFFFFITGGSFQIHTNVFLYRKNLIPILRGYIQLR